MEEGSPDIVLKYQKLAAEYSKMRAQVSVLKKAVSEEQVKNGEMKEAIKEKDQVIRKLEQEVECLNFRNLQLTKRVSVLQNDLDTADDKIKKPKNKTVPNSAPPSSESRGVLNAELMSRIEENEKLHQQVYASEIEHKKAVSELSTSVDTLQSELEKQHSLLSETIKKHESTIDKLSQERAKMEVTLKNYEKELKDVKLKDEMCNEELQFVKQDLGSRLNESKMILDDKILFNDTRWKYQNSLNVPVLLRRKQEQLAALMVELKGFVSELVRRLSDLHTYMEQKIRSLEPNSDISGPINKFGVYLHENTQYLKVIETEFSEFALKIQQDSSIWLEAFSLSGISSALSKYVRYLDKLLPYLLLSIQAEDSIKGTTPRLKEIYRKLQIISRGLACGFSKLERCIQLMVEIASSNQSSIYFISRPVLMRKIISSIDSIQLLFEEAKKVFGAKVILDHQLPTAIETAKNTDDCILSSLVSIVTGMKKITVLMEENMDVLLCEVPYRPRGTLGQRKLIINPCISTFRERGLRYMKHTHEEESPSIPYEIALKNSQTLSTYADSRDSLTQQLEACKSKLSKLELDKEHWMLECQLLKTKQSRMNQSPTQDNSDSSPDDEQTFQFFVKASVNQLVTQIQFADSKVLAFQAECEFLHQKLKLAEQKKVELDKEMTSASNVISTLKEEQQSLMKNYEDQLSMMSEHLATMNETLTAQKDEIDALRQAGSNKATKKGRK